ncbi:xanthine dehydrogenase [Streptomyces sp. ISL-36]|uniref:2Fe-2S iron-sulfur cluster-binding protein n=1 Tax=Streptomyces sp. ISL-36 TaxID=2819182 RepID=UPI001BE5633D|nr:2Fe-2S iron-sulfur cluster-binding protein [Streptomyces sp. ISL-36]MBT2442186.1 xanthine dehydrogenase [Streptomyces sp. ISL-36]
MSNEHHDHDHGQGGGWQPIPQSEGYDGDATAFVQLPPDFMLDGVPLEAPGHGYVPPMITPLTPAAATDPAATGSWMEQLPTPAEMIEPGAAAGAAAGTEPLPEPPHAADPHAMDPYARDPHAADPHATGQWSFPEQAESATTGQWRIPVVSDAADSSDESGEYTASTLSQYAGSAPATLPGGAPAPWAVHEPEQGQEPAPAQEPEPVRDEAPDQEPQPEPQPETAVGPEAVVEPETAVEPDAAVETAAVSTGSSADSDEHPHTSYVLRVNGADRPVTDSWIGESLLYVLRERLGLAGAKDGCSQGECGACNVQVDGRLVASCLVPAATAAGSEVRTVEGLASDGEPSDVQRALARCGAVQCGFCVPGMAMTVHDLLEGNHAPTELEARQALCGNLCRCSGYRGVLDAVREVVAEREASAAATAAANEAADEARIPHQIPHPYDGGMA